MEIITTVSAMVSLRDHLPRPIGLVPTMGYLHNGHLALVRLAKTQTHTTLVTIFVNPTQFGPNEDLANYPRDMEKDLSLLRQEGVDIVFAPEVDDIYPPDFSSYIDVEGLTDRLEGARRPGHFRGVATIVTKLFTIIRPDRSYFGQKDGQQAMVIKRLTQDLHLGTEIVVVPTVRESDGLAMSSRNIYLTAAERRAAPVLYRSLMRVYQMWQSGTRSADKLRREARNMVGKEPLAKLEYVSVADAETLEELNTVNHQAIVSIAVRFGHARLIDNVMLNSMELTS
ncbi:MAG: pantoate--beta-alanine ligase [Chloroflexota bacterium]|nr:pantoate--beta-alanine ligase [Chloroflexota bacterium]